ncbi:hypothetical protein [Burkholderia ubonensis]|uniref:hypothetical protein n=1 Tax=Burkholderia ubonensis TaxID=101571 RepID=UPI001E2DDA00|nr:hypothetical protein [Burkholderia ubonensis]
MLYTGTEAAHVWHGRSPISSALFEIRPSNLSIQAEPLFDSGLDAIIGYRTESGGVTYVYDLDGECVSVTERPLETPLIDPVDAIFLIGSVWRSGARVMARIGGYGAHAIISRSVLSGLRTRFAGHRRASNYASPPLRSRTCKSPGVSCRFIFFDSQFATASAYRIPKDTEASSSTLRL